MSKVYEESEKTSILKEAVSHGVRATAKVWGVSPGTISRWRKEAKAKRKAAKSAVRKVHKEPGSPVPPKKTYGRRMIEALLLSYQDGAISFENAAHELEELTR